MTSRTAANPADVGPAMALCSVPSTSERLSPAWLGGGAAHTAAVLKEQGRVQEANRGAAYGLSTGLFKRHSAHRVAPFSLGVPVVGLAAGMGLLSESVTPWQWGGIAFVVAALAVVMFGARVWKKR